MQRSHTFTITFKSTLSLAIQAAMLGALTLGTSTLVLAENAVDQHNISTPVNIAAGNLDQVLAQFAGLSGVQISYDPTLVAGKKSTGLKGQYGFEQGIAELLKGTGLTLLKRADGAWTIVQHQNQTRDMGQLKPIDVTASGTASRDANAVQLPVINVTAENENSYTVKNTSTATKMNLSIKDTPQSISVVTNQRMDDQNLTSITKVLEQTPGVTISRDSSERFNIYSRGNQISKYQFDGLTTHVENQTQNMTQNLADMSIYDRIEIVRGATGLMTGAGSPSGMVNMIRKKPTKEFQASVTGSIGRWDDYRGQVDVSGSLIDNGKLRGRIVAAKQDNDTFTDYYSQKRDVLYGVAEADLTDSTTVRLGIDYQKYEADGGTGVPLFYTDNEQTNFSRSTTVTSKHRNEQLETSNYFFNIDQVLANDWKLVIAGNYMDVDREIDNAITMRAYSNATVNRVTGEFPVVRTTKTNNPLNQKSAAINLQGPFSLFGREHQAIVGYEFSRYKSHYESYGYGVGITANLSSIHEVTPLNADLYSIQDFYIIQRGYYGALRLNPVDKLHVIVGARASDYKYDTAYAIPIYDYHESSGYKKTGEVTPYAGLVYDLTPEQSVYASYTSIFNPNNVTDINGKVIDPQIGANYELGWKGEFYDGRLNTNVAIYQIKRDNATELAGRNASNVAYYRAIDGMETKGIDIELTGEVLPGWNVSASYSHSRSEDAENTRRTTEHPLDTVKLWNTYNFSGDLDGLTIGGGARWSSKIALAYTALDSKAVQDDHVVFDAMARYKFNQHLSGALNINNIFDKTYYTAIGIFGYAYYGQPRNVVASLTYKF